MKLLKVVTTTLILSTSAVEADISHCYDGIDKDLNTTKEMINSTISERTCLLDTINDALAAYSKKPVEVMQGMNLYVINNPKEVKDDLKFIAEQIAQLELKIRCGRGHRHCGSFDIVESQIIATNFVRKKVTEILIQMK